MGFEQDWGQARSAAADQAAMRLNSGPPPGPLLPGTGDFASTPAEKKAAANTIENDLEPSTKKAADHADEASNGAVKTFDGWSTAAGLKKVQETWDRQVTGLMGRLASEKTALRGTSNLFLRNDISTGDGFSILKPSPDSKLNEL
ncbi:hypothetical protein [Streptomyces sp. NBC_00091]|uniref:hypothetical protein n=1 Tax=Streptomyces sp. NBC_00091 TaxID=2975648 RepID=UPI00225655FD|nr:hypothetical protein [Streptomyces sp. NBC_00091]MCX5377410.1 hypothetical protein [Streptomyces sp. NBC_00091]